MDKRLVRLLKSNKFSPGIFMLDTYNKAIHEKTSCTIGTNLNTANLHFIMEVKIVGHKHKGLSGNIYSESGIAPTITTNKGDGIYIQCLEPRTDGCTNTITTVQKDNLVIEPNKIAAALRGREKTVLGWTRDKNGNVVDWHPVEVANCVTSCKRDNTQNYVYEPKIIQRCHGFNKGGEFHTIAPTITGSTWHHNNVLQIAFRIRKLTERECFRLMGVADEDSNKIRAAVSKKQCYKLAGNSIVVDVLEAIFRELLTKHGIPKFKQLKLF